MAIENQYIRVEFALQVQRHFDVHGADTATAMQNDEGRRAHWIGRRSPRCHERTETVGWDLMHHGPQTNSLKSLR